MIFDFPKPEGSRLVFSEDFRTRQIIQSRGGVITGCSVGDYIGGSIKPTAVSSRVTFGGTESVGINATALTIACRFRTGVAIGTDRDICDKNNDGVTDWQWSFCLASNGTNVVLFWFLPTTGNDTGTYIRSSTVPQVSTEYLTHAVFDGSLAAASRGKLYINGVLDTIVVGGTPPTKLRASAYPVSVLNRADGATRAPPNDFVLRSVRIFNSAFSAQECADDYANDTYPRAFGGGP